MDYIIGRGSEIDPRALKLYTFRNRHFIENEIPDEDVNPIHLRAASELWMKKFPRTQIRSLTAMYNCGGMVFADRRTCINETTFVDTILADDEYRKIGDVRDVEIGDVVVYRKGGGVKHVGVVYEKIPILGGGVGPFRFRVLSQWGADGEYLHHLEDVPEVYGTEVEYWSDRR